MSAIESISESIRFRAPRPSDLQFIIDSWMRSNRRAPWHEPLDESAYFKGYRPLVIELLRLPTTRAIVAANIEDDDQILGYAVWTPSNEPMTIHYVYVKNLLRRRGIARAMVETFAPSLRAKGAAITALGKSLGPQCRFGDLARRFKLSYEPYRLWQILINDRQVTRTAAA